MTVKPNESMTKLSHPFTFECDVETCFYRTAHRTEAAAYADQSDHATTGLCPMGGVRNYMLNEFDERGQQYTAPHMGKNLAEKLWDRLDVTLDDLMKDQGNENLKGQCTGFAVSIQMMMSHYYPAVEDVTREAVKRWKIRQGQIGYEPTAGYLHNPPPAGTKAHADAVKKMTNSLPDESTAKKARSAGRSASPAPTKTASLAPEVDEKIRKALATGLFSDEDIAGSFSVTPAYISALRDNT